MSVYSPVGGWTRQIYYLFPNLISPENYAFSASIFTLYILRRALSLTHPV